MNWQWILSLMWTKDSGAIEHAWFTGELTLGPETSRSAVLEDLLYRYRSVGDIPAAPTVMFFSLEPDELGSR